MDIKIDRIYLLLFTIVLVLKDSLQQVSLKKSPENKAVLLGSNVTFHCQVTQDDGLTDYISWEECITTSDNQCARISNDENIVYSALGGNVEREKRYSVQADAENKQYNLKVSNVLEEDAGKYRCLSRNNAEVYMTAELIILEEDPVCQANFTNTTKSEGTILPVYVSCEVNYFGVQSPVVVFKVGDVIKPGNNHTVTGRMKYDILYQGTKGDGGKTFHAETKFTALPDGDRSAVNVPEYSNITMYEIPSLGSRVAPLLFLALFPLFVVNL